MEIEKLKTELVRKSIHILISAAGVAVMIDKPLTMIALVSGIALYSGLEFLRLRGVNTPAISAITRLASRPRDKGKFVAGPVTLGAGALLAVVCFPPQAAQIAIYALAFGDSLSGLVGRVFGRLRPAFLRGKSVEGSLACFIAVFAASFLATSRPVLSLTAACVSTIVEAFPLRDWDNIVFPLAAGAAVLPFFY